MRHSWEDRKIVGKCSICGGVVSVPTVIWSVVPPLPTCESCGAVMDETANLPVVPMKPTRRAAWRSNTYGGWRSGLHGDTPSMATVSGWSDETTW